MTRGEAPVDMTDAAIDGRLRAVARLSAERFAAAERGELRDGAVVDMTDEAIDERLRVVARLSAEALPPAFVAVDMSEAGVTARLRDWAEISALALELEAAGTALRG